MLKEGAVKGPERAESGGERRLGHVRALGEEAFRFLHAQRAQKSGEGDPEPGGKKMGKAEPREPQVLFQHGEGERLPEVLAEIGGDPPLGRALRFHRLQIEFSEQAAEQDV